MNIKNIAVVICLSMLMAACGGGQVDPHTGAQDTAAKAMMEKSEYLKNLRKLEGEMYKAEKFDEMLALSMVNQYADFARNFPEDTSAADFLFKAGEISTSLKQGPQAVGYFREVREKYPEYRKVQYCLFLQAFVYETIMKDNVTAKQLYEEVIKKYPSEHIAADAKASIQNLGKSDEELIKEFEAKNKGK